MKRWSVQVSGEGLERTIERPARTENVRQRRTRDDTALTGTGLCERVFAQL